MKRKHLKKILSILISISMVASQMSAVVWAEDELVEIDSAAEGIVVSDGEEIPDVEEESLEVEELQPAEEDIEAEIEPEEEIPELEETQPAEEDIEADVESEEETPELEESQPTEEVVEVELESEGEAAALTVSTVETVDGDTTVVNGTCGDNLTWVLDDEGTLTISGEGEMSYFRVYHKEETNTTVPPWNPYLTQIKTIMIDEGVTGIGSGAFMDCSSLTSVTIPDSVTTIGSHAFGNCSSLTSIIIPESVTKMAHGLFDGCSALKSVNIPEGVTSMSSEVFMGCSSLTSITIPEGVTSINTSTFKDCSSLTSVTIPESITSIGKSAFYGCSSLTSIDIPENVTSIGAWAFYGCSSLTSITIPESVTIIGNHALTDCSNLKEIIFEGNAPSIAEDAFTHVTATAYFPAGNTTWTADKLQNYGGTLTWYAPHAEGEHNTNGSAVYEKADELNHIKKIACLGCPDHYATAVGTEPHSTGAEGDRAATTFAPAYCSLCESEYGERLAMPENMVDCGYIDGCDLTWELTTDGTLTISGEGEMAGFSYDSETNTYIHPWNEHISQIKKVVIEEGVTSIGKRAFNGCSALTSVNIPESVTTIGLEAFWECSSLTNIHIPESVTTIENFTFGWCTSLNSIIIPASVKNIEKRAFYHCSGLTEIRFEGNAPTIAEDAFTNVTAAAYTPADNTTWTAEKMQNYGGTLTWNPSEIVIASGTCGENLNWKLTEDGILTISGEGEMQYCNWGSYLQQIKEVVMEEGVTSIGASTFYGCSSLTSVTIPDSVTSIGVAAFWDCTSLESIIIPESVTRIADYTFDGCSSLTSVTIPESVESIGVHAFRNCSSLTSITIPESVTNIESFAFFDCNALTSIVIPEGVTSIANSTFSGCSALISVTIPESVTSIGSHAFWRCSSLTNITIPDSVTSIESQSFRDCSSLTSIIIPEGVTSIEKSTFSRCESLTSITIPESIESIGEYAFLECNGLEEIIFEGSAPEISDTAFTNVTANAYYPANDTTWTAEKLQDYGGTLTWIPTGSSETVIASGTCGENLTWKLTEDGTLTISGEGKMTGNYTTRPWQNYLQQIKMIVIEEGVTSVGNSVFRSSNSLTSVVIPDTVTSIGNYAFSHCENLSSVTIPESVTSIGWYAFWKCSSLTSVTIPASVTSIGDRAFRDCSSLKEIIFEGNAPAISKYAFYNVTATAHFSADDTTWTADKLKNYGGTLTWYAPHAEGEHHANGVVYEKVDELSHVQKTACLGCPDDYAITVGTEPHSVGAAGDRAATSYAPAYCSLCESEYGERLALPENVVDCGFIDECALTWELTEDDTLIISGKGSMTSYSSETYTDRPWESYHQQIKEIVIEEGVTSIGGWVFRDCSSVTSVTIPESVTDLNWGVFYNCESLVSVTIPEGVQEFYKSLFNGCSSLTSVIIPDSVTDIGVAAFNNCESLTSVTIPASVTSIEDRTFAGCSNLTKVIFEGNAPEISDTAFKNVTAVAHTPADNTTWTAEKMQNYGGTLTWNPSIDTITVSGNIDYTANGQTITVNHSTACKVGYLDGENYVAVEAVANDDGTYSFTLPDGVNDVVLVASGDIDGSALINSADRLLVARSLLLESHPAYKALTPIQKLAADINNDGIVNSADRLLLARSLLLESHPAYKEIEW